MDDFDFYSVKVKNLVNRVRKSKDGKVLFSNFAYLSLLQVAGYVFPLITMPYLARVIGPSGFGKIAFASAIMVWIQTIADWGFNYTATRDVAKHRDNIEKVSKIFSTVLIARCVLVLLSFGVLCFLVVFIHEFRDNAAVIFVTFLMVPGHVLFPDWFFQAMERMKYITMLNIISKLFFTIAVFVFIKDKNDYILQPLFVSLGFVVSGFIALYYIFVKWKVMFVFPGIKEVFVTIKKSTDVFINNLMPNLYNSFSVVLLGMFAGPVSNGIYDAGKRFVVILTSLLSVLSRVMFPYLVRKQDKHGLYANISLIISFLCSLFLFVFAPFIIRVFFGEHFVESIVVLRIISFVVFFVVMSSVYGTNYLIVKGFDYVLRNITAVASLIGFVIAFPLIYYFSYVGAALTYFISSMLLGLGCMVYVKCKHFNE